MDSDVDPQQVSVCLFFLAGHSAVSLTAAGCWFVLQGALSGCLLLLLSSSMSGLVLLVVSSNDVVVRAG